MAATPSRQRPGDSWTAQRGMRSFRRTHPDRPVEIVSAPIEKGEVRTMARESKVLKVGDRAPEFRLPDALTGKEVALGDLLGRPLLIYFGRGTW